MTSARGEPLPSVSVVIASGAGGDFLFRLLDALESQARTEGAEVIVPDRVGGETLARLRRDYPWVRAVPVPDAADGRKPSVPALRAEGAALAIGDIVAIIEEHCSAAPDWIAKTLAALGSGSYGAVGGPVVDYGYRRLRDWVVYFLEYHGALPPAPQGETTNLNDANGAIWARYAVPWQPAWVFYRADGTSTFVNNPTSAMSQQDLANRVAALK